MTLLEVALVLVLIWRISVWIRAWREWEEYKKVLSNKP
jgi:hypothetical protein